MRITNNMLANNLLFNLNQNLSGLDKLNQQMNSRKKFSVPSDDPIGTSKSLKLNTDLSKIEQYKRNAQDAQSWMKETESALMEIGSVLHRANVLSIQSANVGTYSKEDLAKIKEEVSQLKEHLIQISNTTYAGRHIFTGYKTDQKLLEKDKDGKVKYNVKLQMKVEDENKEEIFEYNVGVSETIKVNTLGGKVFGTLKEGKELTGDFNSNIDAGNESYLIAVFDRFEKALENLDEDELNSTIGRIKTCMDQVLEVRAEIGAKMNRLELTEKKLDSQVLSTKELISHNEDVDMAEISIKLKSQEAAYRANLAAGAKIIQPSLVEFLR